LLATTPARGLFAKGILESGSGRATPPAEAAQAREAPLKQLGIEPGGGAAAILVDAIQTDQRFRMNAQRLARGMRAHGQDAFAYLFAWESPARRGAFGSCHALEMGVRVRHARAPTQDRFAGSGPQAEALSLRMMDGWAAFAHSGNPSREGVGEWPPFEADTRPTMILGPQVGLEEDPFAEEWIAVAPFV